MANLTDSFPRSNATMEPAKEDHAAPSTRDTFCVLAWNHLQIAPNGTVKMCCIAGGDLSDGERPLNVYSDTYEQIWNSTYMRGARRGMAEGERISPCKRCYEEEATLGQSRRTIQNGYWLDLYSKSKEEFVAEARANGWTVTDRPQFLQLNLGNQCNLACRMCSSQYSSRIQNDPVHNKWMPATYTDVARWRGDKLHIGPRPSVGIRFDGFYDYEAGGTRSLRWSNGHGRIVFPFPENLRLKSVDLTLSLAPGIGRLVRVLINGVEAFSDLLPEGIKNLNLPMDGTSNQSFVDIEIISDSADFGGRRLGVALHDAWIRRDPAGEYSHTNKRTMMRFEENAGWWGQPEFLFDEVLSEPDKLRRIIFQGGEPLIIKEVEDILDYLIEAGATHQIILEIVSNMTIVRESFLQKLRLFRSIELGCSIDGIGSDLEYIRYPAKWPTVEMNILRMNELPNVNVQFNVAVQAYNLMRITDLMRYCDAHGFTAHTHFLVGPYYLSVLILPPTARDIAAQRLEQYLTGDCLPQNRESGSYMLHYLQQHRDVHRRDLYKKFMLFTNDMDLSRNQSFAASHPELLDMLRNDGLIWTDETAYARTSSVTRSDRSTELRFFGISLDVASTTKRIMSFAKKWIVRPSAH